MSAGGAHIDCTYVCSMHAVLGQNTHPHHPPMAVHVYKTHAVAIHS